MKKIKENIIPVLNIIISLTLGIILLFSKLSDNTIYIMVMSLIVGWAIPYLVLLITGITMLYKIHYKLTLIFNIINILLCILLLFLVISIYDNKMLVFLVDYIIIGIMSITNVIYFIITIKLDQKIQTSKKKENEEIKRIKKENNGAIV